jgi:serine protease Do
MVVQQDANSDSEMQYPIVISVEAGSPAQKAGLIAGDTILGYDNIDPRSSPLAMMPLLVPKRKIVVRYRRNGPRTLTMVVAKRPAGSPPASLQVTISATSDDEDDKEAPHPPSGIAPVAIMTPLATRGDVPFAGASVTKMNAGLATAMDVPNAGMLVVDVFDDTPAERAGLKSGDVIVAADGVPVTSASSIIRAMYAKTAKGDKTLTLSILRKGKPQKIHLQW